MENKKTPEEIRALGKKLLDELKEKGANHDQVGQVFVRVGGIGTEKNDQIEDEPPSKARQFRKLRIDLANDLNEINQVKNSKNKD